MLNARQYLLVAVVAGLVALAATWIGRSITVERHAGEGRLHEIMHNKLDLDSEQRRAIDELEALFADRQKALNAELRQANLDLAHAVANEHSYGPAVESAVDRSHEAMGELQKATLRHVFAMRALLRPDQARKFDDAVVEALTQTPQD